MRRIDGLYLLMVLMVSCFSSSAEITLPKILGNDMVLQRDKPNPIWGTAMPGEKVSVKFGKQAKNTITDVAGSWKIILDPMPGSDKPAALMVIGTNTITLNNVLVGEVWICSGQSNMVYEMRKNSKVNKPDTSTANSPVDELEKAHNPAIRIFLVTQKNLIKADPEHSRWSVAQDSALRAFSAAGYFFAKKLNQELHVPVGIICAAISGSRIEPWIPESAFENSAYFKSIGKDSAVAGNDHGKFYHKMIEPLAPLAIRGFLWYQGESNVTETISYTHKMKLLINSWRDLWGEQNLPFYYVQIVPYYYSKMTTKLVITPETEPAFWEAQSIALKVPHTGMIETSDLNDDIKNLHPPFKWEVGRRLALLALAKTYGKKNLVYSGPVYQSMKISGNKIILSFKYTANGLESHDKKPLNYFTIAGKDGKFAEANASIEGNRVIVSSPAVTAPVAVRFGWTEDAQPNLFNKAGLPAMPFRTNNPLKFNPADN
ncbi:sialate O-acetylesterase [Mucilaginibacter sp.]|uniref:sialate O-acetylesterase n=1 Tax=Mucilaginibacter sp. TaxID=1882438 RepID=UPI00260815BC|nr:sialate O-acetylesterase [Mucilaginibacter sp.]MDB4919562.1 Sialate O-acetylesterase [Mucilaginibacter sp.]